MPETPTLKRLALASLFAGVVLDNTTTIIGTQLGYKESNQFILSIAATLDTSLFHALYIAKIISIFFAAVLCVVLTKLFIHRTTEMHYLIDKRVFYTTIISLGFWFSVAGVYNLTIILS